MADQHNMTAIRRAGREEFGDVPGARRNLGGCFVGPREPKQPRRTREDHPGCRTQSKRQRNLRG